MVTKHKSGCDKSPKRSSKKSPKRSSKKSPKRSSKKSPKRSPKKSPKRAPKRVPKKTHKKLVKNLNKPPQYRMVQMEALLTDTTVCDKNGNCKETVTLQSKRSTNKVKCTSKACTLN